MPATSMGWNWEWGSCGWKARRGFGVTIVLMCLGRINGESVGGVPVKLWG